MHRGVSLFGIQHTVTLAAKEKIKEHTYFLDEIGCKKAVKESCLTPYQLERIGNVLVAVLRLKNYLAKGKETNNPLAYYGENSIIFDSVEARKKRHEMGRKLSDVRLEYEEN